MALATADLIAALHSHAAALGSIERVLDHEPKNAPGKGITYALWCGPLTPVAGMSGLAAVSVRLVAAGRLYLPMLTRPEDRIDPRILGVADALCAAYCNDFTLGGQAVEVDIFGAHGVGLSATPGYLTIDQTIFRTVDIVVPIIVDDLWVEAP